MKKNNIAVVIATYNQRELTEKTIRAINTQTVVPDIVLIDNASSEEMKDYFSSRFQNVTVIRLKDNYGGTGGFCVGIHYAYEAGYEWIVVVDNDALPVSGDLIEVLVKEASEDTVTQPLNQDEDTGTDYTFLLFHYGCFHRSIIEKIGFPLFPLFLLHDDTEYLLRIQEKFSIKKVTQVKYSHPLKRVYLPNRFYFRVRNELFIAKEFYVFKQKMIEFLFLISSLLVYRYIGEKDYYRFGFRAVIDFALGRFSNYIIARESKIYGKRCSLTVEEFKQRYRSALFNVDPYFDKKIGVGVNWHACTKSISGMRALLLRDTVVQGPIVSNTSLIFSFFANNIICLDEFQEDVVYYRLYKIRGNLLLKFIYLFIGNLLLVPLIIACMMKLSLRRLVRNQHNFLKYIEKTNVPLNK